MGEETVYDTVEVPNETSQQSDSKGRLSKEDHKKRRRYNKALACCLGILCIISVLEIVRVIVYQTFIQNMRADNQELRKENQELTEEKKSLKEQIQNMENMENELNVSRAQWSINEYCRKVNNGPKCKPCQKGWEDFRSSCFAFNDANKDNQRTWKKAQEDCREKHSNLTAAATEEERNHIISISRDGKDNQGYWIGLRAEHGKWKWIDGTELTNQSWVGKTAADGQCVTSLRGKGWQSVSCEEKNAWICEKKALSVN